MKNCLLKAGLQNMAVVFLFTDTQVPTLHSPYLPSSVTRISGNWVQFILEKSSFYIIVVISDVEAHKMNEWFLLFIHRTHLIAAYEPLEGS